LTQDKDMINQWFCSLVIDQIIQRKESPRFIFSTTFLLFFVLYPIVKILAFILSCILYVVLWSGLVIWLYKRETTSWIVEIIE
jgi:hypothetical protein